VASTAAGQGAGIAQNVNVQAFDGDAAWIDEGIIAGTVRRAG